MSEEQIENQAAVVQQAMSASFTNPGAMLKAMARSLDNALSPLMFLSKIPDPTLSCEEFVEKSPKVRYVCECIQSVKEYHEGRKEPVSGQVIYANRGKEFFPLIKEYLEKVVGYAKKVPFGDVRLDEVEIIESGMSETRKDNVKEAFLAGVVKVVLGTATIKEGVDLQTRGTVLYNMYPDWNPTDLIQLEGRIHRQGNEFGYVRIVMPLVVNSMDVFVFQKLEEKKARINSIWYRADRGNVLDMEQIDPEEIKYALMDNPHKMVSLKLDKAMKMAMDEISLATENLKIYGEMKGLIYGYNTYRTSLLGALETRLGKLHHSLTDQEEKVRRFAARPDDFLDKKTGKKAEEMVEKIKNMIGRMENFLKAVPQDDKDLLDIIRSFNATYWDYAGLYEFESWTTNNFREAFSKVKKAERQILFARNMTIHDDLSDLKAELETELARKNDYLQHVKSEAFKDEVFNTVHREMASRASMRGELWEQVAKFKKLNVLLSYKSDNTDKIACLLPQTDCCDITTAPQMAPVVDVDYVNVETEVGELEQLPLSLPAEPVSAAAEPTGKDYQEAIEAFRVMVDLLEGSEREEYLEAIEAFEVMAG